MSNFRQIVNDFVEAIEIIAIETIFINNFYFVELNNIYDISYLNILDVSCGLYFMSNIIIILQKS